VVSPEFFSSVIELQPCARSDVISGFHYKHVDYYDEALFNRAYEWMKERGHDRRPEPARRARCRLSVAYAGVAFSTLIGGKPARILVKDQAPRDVPPEESFSFLLH